MPETQTFDYQMTTQPAYIKLLTAYMTQGIRGKTGEIGRATKIVKKY